MLRVISNSLNGQKNNYFLVSELLEGLLYWRYKHRGAVWEFGRSYLPGLEIRVREGDSERTKRRERQKKRWEDIKEWIGMGFGDALRAAEDGETLKDIVATSPVVP